MGRQRKKKTETEVSRSPEEAALVSKYPDAAIRIGSWRPSGGRSETHGKKVTVVTVCLCGAETVRASSDLWQCGRHCPQCRKQIAKNKADKKKQAK